MTKTNRRKKKGGDGIKMPTCANGKNKPHSKGNGKKKRTLIPGAKKKDTAKQSKQSPKPLN
jgi:hypothetical protein